MAKAKGKKIDAKAPKGKKIDAKAPKGKKIDDEFARPSDAPSGGDGWRLETEDHIGDLFLITPLREQTVKGFEDADTNVIVASIVHLDEKKPAKSEEHEEVFVWARWIQGSLRGYIGTQRVLGRLAQDKSKAKGKNAAWVLEDADDDDIETARDYLRYVTNPLASTKPAKGKKK